jgi:hypothetical protein
MFINPSPRLAGDDWNYAYMKAKTSLVTIAHQDDYYEPRFLEDTLSAFNRYPNNDALMAFSDYYEIRDGTRADHNIVLAVKRLMNFPFRFESLNGRLFIKRRILAFGNPICCPAVTLNKDLAGEAVFDTTYKNSCDYQTWVDLAAVRGRFVYIPRKLVGHRIYEESATSRNIKEDIRSKEDFAILSSLWPAPIARLIHFFFSKSEKSNAIKKT